MRGLRGTEETGERECLPVHFSKEHVNVLFACVVCNVAFGQDEKRGGLASTAYQNLWKKRLHGTWALKIVHTRVESPDREKSRQSAVEEQRISGRKRASGGALLMCQSVTVGNPCL